MSVTSEQTRIAYAGNNVNQAFPVPWYFTAPAALLVLLRVESTGAETIFLLGTDYTVTGAGSPSGGTVTTTLAPLSGTTLHIIHDPALLQSLVLAPGAALPVQALERQLDEIVLQQQRTRDLASRTPYLPDTDTDGAGAYDAAGNRIQNLGAPVAGNDAATKAWALGQFATASGPSALPPAGSLVAAMWDPASPLEEVKVGGRSAFAMTLEADPFPAGVLSPANSLEQMWQRLQYQLRRTINWLDGGARAHAYEDVPAADLPTVVASQVAAAIAATTTAANRLPNGSQLVAQRYPSESASVAVAQGFDTFVVDRWFCLATGGGVTVNRRALGLGPHSLTRSALGVEIVGAAGVTGVRYGVRIGREAMRALGAKTNAALVGPRNVTFGMKFRHSGSAGTITPQLVIRSTSNTGDDSTAAKFAAGNMTTRLTQNAALVGAGGEATFFHTFDLWSLIDHQNGLELYIELGALNTNTRAITLSDFFLADGDITSTLVIDDFHAELERARRYYQKSQPYAVQPTVANGLPGALVASGSSGSNPFAFVFQHSPPLRGAPVAVVTYNPIGANSLPRNTAGDDGALGTLRADAGRTHQEFTTSGSKERAWYLHMATDAEWYD